MRGDRAERNRRHKAKRKKVQDQKQRSRKKSRRNWKVRVSKNSKHQDKQRRVFRKQIEVDRLARSYCVPVLAGDADNLFL